MIHVSNVWGKRVGREFDPTEDVRLIRQEFRAMKQLEGFQPHHTVPQRVGVSELRMLHQSAQPDLDAILESVFAGLRNAFGFKRRELQASDVVDGGGRIETPGFDYEIAVEPVGTDLGQLQFVHTISRIRKPATLFGTPFGSVFPNGFQLLELIAPEPISVEDVIDRVEALEPGGWQCDYDKRATWCELAAAETRIRVTAEAITVRLGGHASPDRLFQAFLDSQDLFADSFGQNPFAATGHDQ